ncbi:MAG: hypothetical protein EA391_02475 [Balneolaceae bacterium]|nr:MAG: hypothetical protein EA391_02475 [Balneolaceae bacterium]
MAKKKRLLLYGSYGFTGNLIAEAVSGSGIDAILSGRDEKKLKAQAEKLNLPYIKASLHSAVELDSALSDAELVLHCAGPFIHTWKPMAEACLRNNCHYLDITGEIEVFEALKGLDASFKEKNLMAMPGTGFDVVPTDCMSAYLKQNMPDATHLELAFRGLGGGVSRGTAKTMVENFGEGSVIRKNGKLKKVSSGSITRTIPFTEKPQNGVAIPWGDLSTAFYTTGIDNIIVYVALPDKVVSKMKWMKWFNPVLRLGWVKRFAKNRIEKRPAGPTDEQRRTGSSVIWGEVRNHLGEIKHAEIATKEGYQLTADISLIIAKKVMNGDFKPGFSTPASCYGHELIFELGGSEWLKK